VGGQGQRFKINGPTAKGAERRAPRKWPMVNEYKWGHCTAANFMTIVARSLDGICTRYVAILTLF